MNILLVAVNAKYIHSNPAVFSLKSCTGVYEPYVSVVEFTINQPHAFILRKIHERHPDVIAFSCYIWNRDVIERLIPDLHKILPDADIWAGGPEVSYHVHEILPDADICAGGPEAHISNILEKWQLRGIMVGRGEGAFRHLVSAYVNGKEADLPAVLHEKNTSVLSLDEIPFWYQDLSDFSHRIIYYESSRGCPFSCSYCLSSLDKTMDFRSVERVCRELDYFLQQNVPQVKFVDRTFNCRKDHALPILKHILTHDNGVTNFHFEIAADLLDEDYFAVLGQMRPGAVQLEIGVQSTCVATIAEIDRRMDFTKTAAAVRRISSGHNVHIHLDLIAGLPLEDYDTFQKSFNDVYALCPEQLQLGFLKVLKGSGMERCAAEYELSYTAHPPYEVLSTKWLSYEDVCRLKQVEEVLELYYNSGQFAHTLNFLLAYFDTPYAMYERLASWYEEHGLFVIQSSRIRKYEILLEFGTDFITVHMQSANAYVRQNCLVEEAIRKQIQMLKEYLTYDLYLREHMKNRPSFALSLEHRKAQIHDLLQREARTHEMFPALQDHSYRELARALHVEAFEHIFDRPAFVLFSYDRQNPLNGQCGVRIKEIQADFHDLATE